MINLKDIYEDISERIKNKSEKEIVEELKTCTLRHRNFIGSVKYSSKDNVFYGKIENINNLVSYEAENLPKLKIAFEESVNDYIITCINMALEKRV